LDASRRISAASSGLETGQNSRKEIVGYEEGEVQMEEGVGILSRVGLVTVTKNSVVDPWRA
jgi:hypothetical protein